jgi:hypothetical protein
VLIEIVEKTNANWISMPNRCIATLAALAVLMAAANVGAAEKSQSRLKFRGKGPVCSCASGMSEADIQKAMEARFAQPEDVRGNALDDLSANRDEQRRKVDEAQPR